MHFWFTLRISFINCNQTNSTKMPLAEHIAEMSLTTLPVTAFIGIYSILGITGNVIVMYVYNRRYPTCNFKYFVLVLAGIDLASCVILMPLEMYTLAHWYQFNFSWLCKVKSFLNVFTVTSSAAVLLLIAIDRFRKVCKPHSKQIQPRFALKLTVLVLLLSVIPASSDAVFWGIHTHVYTTNGANFTARMCEKDDDFKHTQLPKLHVAILYAGVNSIVMLSTVVLYILIAVKLFCIPTGPVITTPQIMVQTSYNEDSGVVTPKPKNGDSEKENVFKFPVDIESGLSESEDLDFHTSVDLSDSQGNITENSQDDVTDDIKNKDRSDDLEMVPLRQKGDDTLHSNSEKKVLRISMEGLTGPGDRNSLQVPNIVVRRPPKSPVSPTANKAKSSRYQRRRSTIGSLSTHTGIRLRRKTLIMFILTSVFVTTTVLYFCLIGLMADNDSHFVTELTTSEQTTWLFFLRLYFINSVINPILYGFLDPRFRKALWNMGVRIKFTAGSLKRSIGMSLRSRSSTGNTRNEVTVLRPHQEPRPILKSRSSATVST